jgi:hypothetical protein
VGDPERFDQWCIVELLGHVRMAGRVTEEEHFGGKLGRVYVPDGDGFTTVYFTAASLYRVTPTTEEIARAVAARNRPEPVHRWELEKPDTAPAVLEGRDERDDDGPDFYDH